MLRYEITGTICLSNLTLTAHSLLTASCHFQQATMLAIMKKLTYDDEYNFENEVIIICIIMDQY